jgi:hypothetical protein
MNNDVMQFNGEVGFRIHNGVGFINGRPREDAEVNTDGNIHHQILVKFKNGYELSIIFGTFAYCSNRDNDLGGHGFRELCEDAEIAILKPNGKFYKILEWGDDVLGYQTPEEVLKWIEFVKNL